eukprot:scaffold45276_cov281-Isochrysis_galbana.AAC.2
MASVVVAAMAGACDAAPVHQPQLAIAGGSWVTQKTTNISAEPARLQHKQRCAALERSVLAKE